MTRAGVIALVLACAGCDVVFGLDGRHEAIDAAPDSVDADPCPNDRDCDLVLDPIDNCIDVPNPGQDDFNDDDMGDACEECLVPRSATDDDDGDGRADLVDRCPAISEIDPDADADADGVGDECDPQPSKPNAISCFMSFGSADATKRMWSLADPPWSVQASRLIHVPADTPPFTVSLGLSGILRGDAYELRAPIQFSGIPGMDFRIGIGLGEPGIADPGVRCVLDGADTVESRVTLLASDDTILASQALPPFTNGTPEIAFRVVRQGATTALTCSIVDGAQSTMIDASGPMLGELPTPHLISSFAHTVFLSLTAYRIVP